MIHFGRKISFFLLIFNCLTFKVHAAFLNRPELVDYNFAGANICEKSSLKIKFDHQQFNVGNIFTIEISQNGTFTPGNTITMIGSLTQSGNMNSVNLTVDFPSNVPAGNNYRLRVKGSNPVTYSENLNEHPFFVSKLIPSDPNFFPTGYWRGNFYRWTPSITGTITDANSEDIFNPNNYIGYVTEDTMSFDYNWGNNGNAPGSFPDSNKVCGTYRDFFSVRMKRRVNFEAGYYIFGGGGDDGFRLSIDGGVTWLIEDWSDHAYRGSLTNGGCGVLLTAGTRDVVVEFYENKTDARFRTIIIKTGDPAVNTISILSPLNGATICSSALPFQMTASPMGAWQWSGPGVSSNGILNPQIGGTGFRTISYQTGFAADGQNCVKTASVTVNVLSAPSAQFAGLDSSYCTSAAVSNLQPQNPGGTFSGPGITGNAFSPILAGPGNHIISHIINDGVGICSDTVKKVVKVTASIPVSIQNLTTSICRTGDSIILSGSPIGGVFSGPGVSNSVFHPDLANIGSNSIQYTFINGACINVAQLNINVLIALSAQFSGLQSELCATTSPLTLVPQNSGGIFSGPGVTGTTFSPQSLSSGTYKITHILNVPGGCIDTASFSVQITVPIIPLFIIPSDLCTSSDPVFLEANVQGTFTGPGVNGNLFNPALANIGANAIVFTSVQGPCVLTANGNIIVLSQPNAVLSLGTSGFCINQTMKSKISVSPAGGILSGIGIVGDSISVVGLALGQYVLKYIIESGTCKDTATQIYNVFDLPDAGFTDLPDTLCEGAQDIFLQPNVPGGLFSGQGLSQDRKYFQPSQLLVNNTWRIYYNITFNGCSNRGKDSVMIIPKLKPKVTFPTLKNKYCSIENAFSPQSNPPGNYFLNGNPVTQIAPASLAPGQYVLKAVYRPVTNLECIDSASANFSFSIIANPIPDLGPDFEIEEGKQLNIDPKITGSYAWVSDPEKQNLEPSKPLTFVPDKALEVFVLATDPSGTCLGKDSVKFTIRPAVGFPSLITPNGDSKNDVFEIKGAYPNMKVAIFNRWGKEVYSGTNSGNIGWEPKSKVETGLYFYTVSNPGDGRVWTGWVMVDF